MPEISLFYGIRVTMYYDDHNPPHFHAEYNGNKAIIEIDTARCIKGALPSRQLKLILAWCVLHQDELMQNWELSKDGKPLNRINPLVQEMFGYVSEGSSGSTYERLHSICVF